MPLDAELLAQLKHQDPHQRRQAIISLGKTGDRNALKPLAEVHRHDPEPALRDLALKAGQYIVKQERRVTTTPVPSPKPTPPTPPLPSSAELLPIPTVAHLIGTNDPAPDLHYARYATRKTSLLGRVIRLTLFAFMMSALVSGGLLVYLYQKGELDRSLFEWNLPHAQALPRSTDSTQDPLAGNLYLARVSPETTFYLQEPVGIAPPQGWPLILGIHGPNGDGKDVLFWGREAEGVLLIAPSFSPTEPGGNAYSGAQISADIQAILEQVSALYPINPAGRVLFGLGVGGTAAAFHSIHYPDDFNAVALVAASEYPLIPDNTPVHYLVLWGEDDPHAGLAWDFVQKLNRRSDVTWESAIFAASHRSGISLEQMARIFALLPQ